MPFPQRIVPERTDIPDVYQDNAQNILQKSCVSNMIGLLQQLNKISIFASEVFKDILETTDSNNKRISVIKERINKIEQKVPSTEQMFLDNSPSYFYDAPFTGKEWQRRDPLRGLLFRRDRATLEVNRRRDIANPLPDLSALDKISPSGPCIKKFSDSNFFMNEWLEAEKKKMEEEKKKRKERKKKKRQKKKRQKAETIQTIAKDYFDPVTGQKISGKAGEKKVRDFNLTDSNTAGSTTFESGDGFGMENSRVAQMANTQKKKKKKQQKKKEQKKRASQIQKQQHQSTFSTNLSSDPLHQNAAPSYVQIPNLDKINESKAPGGPPPAPGQSGASGQPPPVPTNNAVPPPVPSSAVPPPVPSGARPPPVPSGAMQPPPVPQQPPQPVDDGLNAFRKMAKMRVPKQAICNKMRQSGVSETVISHYQNSGVIDGNIAGGGGGGAAAAAPSSGGGGGGGRGNRPKQMMPAQSQSLLAGIRGGGRKLKKTVQVKREPVQDQRSMLMNALRKKGKTGLKHVREEEKNVKKEEEVDNTIYAILNRRKFMAEDSDSSSDDDDSWGTSEED